jgi:hypothetical protein
MQKPSSQEYNPIFKTYIDKCSDEPVIDLLKKQQVTIQKFMQVLKGDDLKIKYEKDKWSVAEVLGHIADTERVMSTRALHISRGDQNKLPGFDHDSFVINAGHANWNKEELAAEIGIVRAGTISLLSKMTDKQEKIIGNANGSPVSPRALACIIFGHMEHHVAILKKRYLIDAKI